MTTSTLAQKLLSVQRKIGAVTKSSSNPHFRSKYADLNEVLDVAKEALNSEGIFITQSPGANEFGKYLETALIDSDSGQQVQGRVFFSGSEENMQKIGAAITYARRFGLVSLLALESEDDDGETAVGRAPEVKKSEPAPAKMISKPTAAASAPNGTLRKNIDAKISLTSKVLIDSKRTTGDEVVAMLQAYGVKTKEELNDDQARKLLTQLEGKLNG